MNNYIQTIKAQNITENIRAPSSTTELKVSQLEIKSISAYDSFTMAVEEDKQVSEHLENQPEKLPPNGDTALALFAQGTVHYEPIDPAEDKRLVRKIDCMILPYLSVCYAFYYVCTMT